MQIITEKFLKDIAINFVAFACLKFLIDFNGGIYISWWVIFFVVIIIGVISLIDEITYILDFWNNFNFLIVHISLLLIISLIVGWDRPMPELTECEQLQTRLIGKPKNSFSDLELRDIRTDFPYEYNLYFTTNVGVCGVCNIKGNHSYYGDLIYHMPWQQYYSATNPEEWFCTEQQARNAGYRKSYR